MVEPKKMCYFAVSRRNSWLSGKLSRTRFLNPERSKPSSTLLHLKSHLLVTLFIFHRPSVKDGEAVSLSIAVGTPLAHLRMVRMVTWDNDPNGVAQQTVGARFQRAFTSDCRRSAGPSDTAAIERRRLHSRTRAQLECFMKK